MPSTNKTPNLGLNQWAGNEYPKRDDFNSDNLKADTAIGKLTDLTTTDKTNLVKAINELVTSSAEKVPQTDFTNHTGNTTDAHGINTKSPLRITNATIASNTTLALDNANKRIIVNSASATTITIPLNSTVAFTVGDEIEIVAYGIGKVTIAGEVGTTIRSRNNYKSIDGQYGAISLLKIATDEWLIIGALTA